MNQIIAHKNKFYIKTDTGYREIISSTDKSLNLPLPTDKFLKEWVNNPVDIIEVEYIITHPKMEYNGLDNRGDSKYYCPNTNCQKGGSYMGIVGQENIPSCYKKECEETTLLLTNNTINCRFIQTEESWDDIFQYFKKDKCSMFTLTSKNWLKENYEVPKKLIK